MPSSTKEWLDVVSRNEEKWQYPNCLDAVDGKHLVLQPPPASGFHFFNYKKTHSMVLVAVVGPDYECLYVDVEQMFTAAVFGRQNFVCPSS